MFGRNEESIDAAAEIEASEEQRRISGERGPSTLGSSRRHLPAGAKPLIIAGVIALIGVGGFAVWKSKGVRAATEKRHSEEATVKNVLSPLAQPAIAERAEATAAATSQIASSQSAHVTQTPSQVGPVVPKPLTKRELLEKRRLESGLGSERSAEGNAGAIVSQVRTDVAAPGAPDGELQRNLQPLRLKASAAGLLGDRNYLLTQGAMIDCQLETRIVTTQAGMIVCYGTRDVYSTNGSVVLAPRGTKYVGNYQGGIKQGQARIFALWSRLETPDGVIVALDSPGTGPLGESGVGGIIDNHFFERFGTAVLISLIGDVGQFLAGQAQKGSNNTIQFGGTTQGTEQAGVEVLKSTMNIPPTLYKNQGDRIAIFVARDLDFSGVYSLRSE